MEEKQRALAHIENIAWIKPIEGADNIELVGVLGWQCIAKKGEFNVGDFCVYIEIDSKVPETEEFEFLKAKHYKIKTMKLNKFKDEYGNGVMSQGIAIPLSVFNKDLNLNELPHGTDVTELLHITYASPDDIKRKGKVNPDSKYQSMIARRKKVFSRPWIKKMMKYKWFRVVMFALYGKKKDKPLSFPSWIQKTDEERIENLPQYLNDHETKWVMTEKIDGTSTTFALDKKHFGASEFIVCSRNVRMRKPDQPCFFDENVYWKIAQKYDIENVLKQIVKKLEAHHDGKIMRIVLQGETYGAKLQGNPYKMDDIDFRAFNLISYSAGNGKNEYFKDKYGVYTMKELLKGTGVETVPVLGEFVMPENITMHDFKLMADGMSVIANVKREGIVYRNVNDARQSFKNVSNDYLLKHSS